MTIEPVRSLESYFRERVDAVVVRRALEVNLDTRDYLARLLESFAVGPTARTLEGSLVLRLDGALNKAPGEQWADLQSVGDGALYAVSFFPDALARAQLDPGLYVNVGTFAYGRAANLLRCFGAGNPVVLVDLGARFTDFVDVLSEIATSSALGNVSRDVVRLFDRWKHTGSSAVLDAMARLGAFPAFGGGSKC